MFDVDFIYGNLWRLSPAGFAEHLTNGKFKRYPHVNLISDLISKKVLAGNARIIVSLPPRHGKSHLISTYTPVWFLSLFPMRNVILTSYEANFAASWGRAVRNIVNENSNIGVSLANDSQASDRWHTSQGGGMFTAGVGGPITGRGFHLGIIDDYCKNWEEATSEAYRKKTLEWFHSTFYTRAEPGASIIILATRWHEDDLIGHLIKTQPDRWTEVKLPALAEENDPLERTVGAALCSPRYDVEKLLEIKSSVGSLVWNSLYQQRPSALEGNIFKRSWFKYYDDLPRHYDGKIQSWDLSFKDSTGSDYVVGQVWQKSGPDFYLIDQIRERMNFPDTVSAIRTMSATYPHCDAILIEDKANGPAVIDTLRNEISGLIPVEPDGSKLARAAAISALFEAGNVYVPNPKRVGWSLDYVEELCSFPNCRNDDQVDATSQALRKISELSAVHTIMSVRSTDEWI